MDDKSPTHNNSPEEMYELHSEFFFYPIRRFTANPKSLREAIKKEKEIITAGERDYLHDQTYFPRKKKTPRGVNV